MSFPLPNFISSTPTSLTSSPPQPHPPSTSASLLPTSPTPSSHFMDPLYTYDETLESSIATLPSGGGGGGGPPMVPLMPSYPHLPSTTPPTPTPLPSSMRSIPPPAVSSVSSTPSYPSSSTPPPPPLPPPTLSSQTSVSQEPLTTHHSLRPPPPYSLNLPLLQTYLKTESHEEAYQLLKFSDDQKDSPGLLANQTALIKQHYDPRMKFSFFSSSTQFVQGKSLHQVHQALQDNEPFWLDVYQPTDVDLRLLALIFHIHPLTIEDMLSDDEIREKCELFDKYLFLCLQTFTQEDPFMESFYYLLLFPWCVVSVRFTPLVHPLHVLIRLTTSRKQRDWAPDWIVYAILDDIMDGFLPVIKALEFDVDSIDDLVLILKSNEQEDMLTRIRGASKKVTQFMRLLHFKDEVVKSFSNRSTKYVHQDTLWYVRDIQDHIATLHQALQITKENLHNAHNIYLSQVSVELSKLSVTSNKIMNRISIQGFVFVPLTFVTGLFGMNINLPFQRADNQPAEDYTPFIVILTIMIVFAIVSIVIARRLRTF